MRRVCKRSRGQKKADTQDDVLKTCRSFHSGCIFRAENFWKMQFSFAAHFFSADWSGGVCMIVLTFCPRNFSLRKTCRTLPLKQVFFSMRIYDWKQTGKRQTLEAAAGRAANWEARALFETTYTKSERELMKEVRQERKYCFCLDAYKKSRFAVLALFKQPTAVLCFLINCFLLIDTFSYIIYYSSILQKLLP